MDNVGGWAEDTVGFLCNFCFFHSFFPLLLLANSFPLFYCVLSTALSGCVCSLIGSCIDQSPGVLPIVPWSTSYHFGLLLSLFGLPRDLQTPSALSVVSCSGSIVTQLELSVFVIAQPLNSLPLTKPYFLCSVHLNIRILWEGMPKALIKSR